MKASVGARLCVLTNIIPPYREEFYRRVSDTFRTSILTSVPHEPNRNWNYVSDGLPITACRSITVAVKDQHGDRTRYIHIPIDTLWRLARYSPDIMVTSEMGLRSAFAALFRLVHPKTSLILWATLSEATEAHVGTTRRFWRRWLLKLVDGVIVNGQSGKRYVRSLGVPEDAIRVVNQGSGIVQDSKMDEIKRRTDIGPFRFVYAGQLVKRKNLMAFFEALAEIRGDAWMCTVVGTGPEQEELSRYCLSRNLDVTFLGARDWKETNAVIASADCLVLPTLADEWGLVVNEALASGVPVCGSTHAQACEELLSTGVNGWLFDATSRSDMESALRRAILEARSPDVVEALSRGRESYTASTMADRWIAAVDSIYARSN